MGFQFSHFFSENWPFVSRRELIENWSAGPSSPAELRLCSPSFASGARDPFRFAQEDLFDVCNFDSLKRANLWIRNDETIISSISVTDIFFDV